MSHLPQADFSALVESIVASYKAAPATRHIDAGVMPSRDTIIDILKLMRELLFPGYFGRQNLRSENLVYHVGELVGSIHDKLFEQVRAAIRHQATRKGEACGDCDASALATVREFLGNVSALRDTLATDVQAAFDGDPAAKHTDEIIFSYPGLFAITVFRIAHELFLAQVPLIPRIMTEYAHNLTGIDIHPGATIGNFFFIDHGTGVVIGETCTIGQHVKIYQGVTLGALSTRGGQSLRGHKRHPELEDEVTVYAGATILGGDTIIGKGATISGNVFLTQSVPAGSRVSAKNPELQIKNRPPAEFKQDYSDWQI